ncbi:MAG TPA: molybdenum cofactor guanylyltransferase [Acidimicrobiia bacterium]|jgi:molybdopterin-guanine dinucleotide biosynthesis protein A
MPLTAGLLLTGGASRRMGRPKATIEWRGERLADRAARVLQAVCAPVFEVGPGYSAVPTVDEDEPGAGPLAALHAGFRALDDADAGERAAVLLACDLPFVGVETVRLLADWPGDGTVVPVADAHPQVLCARYGADARLAVPRLLADGRRSLRALVDAIEPVLLDEADWRVAGGHRSFVDLDTPADLERWSGEE